MSPVPIRDETYGSGWRLPVDGQEVILFFAPSLSREVPEPNTETTSNTKESSERKERIEVTGRVGRTPELKQTAKGVPITKFPLAEHPDGKEGETVWHTIVSFKTLAQKVSETVKKGDEVKVIGYRQERSYNNKTSVEINAVVVKPSKSASEPTNTSVSER